VLLGHPGRGLGIKKSLHRVVEQRGPRARQESTSDRGFHETSTDRRSRSDSNYMKDNGANSCRVTLLRDWTRFCVRPSAEALG
jgi:hypothetical protein